MIIAICAAGPPQARQPNLRKRMKIEPGESAGPEGIGRSMALASVAAMIGVAKRPLPTG